MLRILEGNSTCAVRRAGGHLLIPACITFLGDLLAEAKAPVQHELLRLSYGTEVPLANSPAKPCGEFDARRPSPCRRFEDALNAKKRRKALPRKSKGQPGVSAVAPLLGDERKRVVVNRSD